MKRKSCRGHHRLEAPNWYRSKLMTVKETMILKFITAASASLALVVPITASAQQSRTAGFKAGDLDVLEPLCAVVFDHTRSSDPKYRWEFENLIFFAAGVRPQEKSKPTSEEIDAVGRLYRTASQHFKCNTSDFDVINGDWLKYGVSISRFQPIIFALTYKLDLNTLDSNGETLLDHIGRHLSDKAGFETGLVDIYDKVRSAGAKYRCELPGWDREKPYWPQNYAPPSAHSVHKKALDDLKSSCGL